MLKSFRVSQYLLWPNQPAHFWSPAKIGGLIVLDEGQQPAGKCNNALGCCYDGTIVASVAALVALEFFSLLLILTPSKESLEPKQRS